MTNKYLVYSTGEKEMAIHSRVLAWSIPGMAEPGGLPPVGSHRVGHDWSDLAAAAAAYSTGNSVLCNDWYGKRIWKRLVICICITESFCCTAEANTTLWINYMPIKIWKEEKNVYLFSTYISLATILRKVTFLTLRFYRESTIHLVIYKHILLDSLFIYFFTG